MQAIESNSQTSSMPLTHSLPARPLPRKMQLREAIVMSFCDPFPGQCAPLLHRSHKEWQSLLEWLDTSGLALYFLDRLTELDRCDLLPSPILARLQQNLADNTERIGLMIAESLEIQRRFQAAGISYAVLKGFSLSSISVPRIELRSQLDLDFLVNQQGAIEGQRILEEMGYHLHARDARNLDFIADESHSTSLNDLYKARKARKAELHIEYVPAGRVPLLSRTESLSFHGLDTPILPPVDLFLGQGLHLYKHVCGQYWRVAHLIEFRRHIIARHDDRAFWHELQQQVAGNRSTCIRLGVVTHLITHLMGQFAPQAFTRWTVDTLPTPARLWVERYGHRTALAGFPGNKLYLILEQELETAGLPVRRTLLQALVPRRLPPAIAHATEGETLLTRLRRHRRQWLYNLARLRFSVVEGARYLRESVLWRQYRNEHSQ